MCQRLSIVAAAFVLAVTAFASEAPAEETEKEFPKLHFTLTLPSPDFEWRDHSKIPQCVAAFGNDAGVLFMVLVSKNEIAAAIDDDFVRGFDQAIDRPGVISKLSGKFAKFRGIRSYEYHFQLAENNAIVTGRAFAANGFLYQLQIVGSPLPLEQRDQLDTLFSAFNFTSTPTSPNASATSSEQQVQSFSIYMGRIAAYCGIGIVAIIALGKLVDKKKKSS